MFCFGRLRKNWTYPLEKDGHTDISSMDMTWRHGGAVDIDQNIDMRLTPFYWRIPAYKN